MNILRIYKRQLELATDRFSSVVEDGEIIHTPGGLPQKLRLHIVDGSVADVFLSPSGRYSYHWERRHIDGTIYRHDNAPHKRWAHIETFPKHFHDGSEADQDGKASYISDDPFRAIEDFLKFVESVLQK